MKVLTPCWEFIIDRVQMCSFVSSVLQVVLV